MILNKELWDVCIKCNNSYDDDSALYCDKQKECETIWRGDSMSKHTEKLELIAIDKLIPYANNARTHSDEQIKKIQASLREFGFVNPVLVDKDLGIIAGHGRVEAAKHEGLKKVPCVMVDHLTEAQKKAYILADNRLALDAGWDMGILKVELEGLQDIDFDISIAGFDDDEIKGIMGEHEAIDLDDYSDRDAPKTLCHCPKCGFEFEV